eukprot:8208857-Prorocentrum_lima.AAC.1
MGAPGLWANPQPPSSAASSSHPAGGTSSMMTQPRGPPDRARGNNAEAGKLCKLLRRSTLLSL